MSYRAWDHVSELYRPPENVCFSLVHVCDVGSECRQRPACYGGWPMRLPLEPDGEMRKYNVSYPHCVASELRWERITDDAVELCERLGFEAESRRYWRDRLARCPERISAPRDDMRSAYRCGNGNRGYDIVLRREFDAWRTRAGFIHHCEGCDTWWPRADSVLDDQSGCRECNDEEVLEQWIRKDRRQKQDRSDLREARKGYREVRKWLKQQRPEA